MRKIIFFIVLNILFIPTYSQENDSIQKQDIEGKNDFQKIREAFNTKYMKFGGYSLFYMEYNDTKDVKLSARPRLALISMQGELTKELKYYILADFVDPLVYELYTEWTPKKEFNVRLGGMKTPLSYENQISLTVLETTSNTRSVLNMTGMTDEILQPAKMRNSTGRDVGLLFYGDAKDKLVEYAAGFYQGVPIGAQENNNVKDFATSLSVQPIKGFRIGGSGYWGQAKYIKVGQTEADDHVRNRWIVSTDYKSDRFSARAEWINANDGGIKEEGLYGIAQWYCMPKKLNVLGKVDYYNKDKSNNTDVIDYIVGLNYYFYKSCRFQLNYTYSDYSKNWGQKNSNAITGQLQVVF